jgi:hypothetical protein
MKPCSMAPKFDGVVKTLHLVRCYIFSIITTYPICAEIIEKLHASQEVPLGCASNLKLFTYPSELRFL